MPNSVFCFNELMISARFFVEKNPVAACGGGIIANYWMNIDRTDVLIYAMA